MPFLQSGAPAPDVHEHLHAFVGDRHRCRVCRNSKNQRVIHVPRDSIRQPVDPIRVERRSRVETKINHHGLMRAKAFLAVVIVEVNLRRVLAEELDVDFIVLRAAEEGVVVEKERRHDAGRSRWCHHDFVAAVAVELLRLQFCSGEVLSVSIDAVKIQPDFALQQLQVVRIPGSLVPICRNGKIGDGPNVGIQRIECLCEHSKPPEKTWKKY